MTRPIAAVIIAALLAITAMQIADYATAADRNRSGCGRSAPTAPPTPAGPQPAPTPPAGSAR